MSSMQNGRMRVTVELSNCTRQSSEPAAGSIEQRENAGWMTGPMQWLLPLSRRRAFAVGAERSAGRCGLALSQSAAWRLCAHHTDRQTRHSETDAANGWLCALAVRTALQPQHSGPQCSPNTGQTKPARQRHETGSGEASSVIESRLRQSLAQKKKKQTNNKFFLERCDP